MFLYHKTLITMKNWQSLSFGEYIAFLEGGGFDVKLVAPKVNNPSTYVFLYIILFLR